MRKSARILKYKSVDSGKTQLIVEVDEDLSDLIVNRKLSTCEIRFDDGRHISALQRKKAYATINDIADFMGDVPEYTKEQMKFLYMIANDAENISLSDCTMTEAREYINTLMDFALKNGIELKEVGADRTDDIDAYLYSCIKYKRCCVCGRDGEVHHCEGSRIGMGNDRRKVSNEGRKLICLCRTHHTEIHTKPESEFFEKYKVYGIEVE